MGAAFSSVDPARWRTRLHSAAYGWLQSRCRVCEFEPGDPLCTGCATDFFDARVPRCAACALKLPAGTAAERCGRCLRSPPRFDATWALADYVAPVDGMVLALKFNGRLSLARAFGTLLAQRAGNHVADADAICPVPLAFERHAERGFNQALEIARQFASLTARCLRAELLLRTRHTAAQMELALAARRGNVRGAFAARADLRGQHIVVVDDVMTSGATLDEIAGELKRAGAARVTNLVVARTP